MASPNHKAGLAVVVPTSDNRSPTQRKSKQHALNVPRNRLSQSNGNPPPQLMNVGITPRQPNAVPHARQPNGAPFRRQCTGVAPFHPSNGTLPTQPRLLSVDEALQFSPFSSIVPFGPNIIPTPNADLPGSQPIFSTSDERHISRQPLEYLGEELSRTQGQSSVAQRSKHELKAYLNPDVITDFKFKVPTGLNGKQERPQATANGNGHNKSSSNLSPFADLLLNATELAHRYPTPISPEDTPPVPKTGSQPPYPSTFLNAKTVVDHQQPQRTLSVSKRKLQTLQQQSPVTPTSQRFTSNEVAFLNNSQDSAIGVYGPTPAKPQQFPLVVIPPPSVESRKSDFVTYEEPAEKNKDEASRKRKRDAESHKPDRLSQTKDQRAASDETLRQLKGVIQDIFEADDQSQLDGAGITSSVQAQYFALAYREEQETNTLAPAVHVRLESILHKAITAGRLVDIPADHLQRIQGLCEGALTSVKSSDLSIEHGWNTDDFAGWLSRLDVVDLGLRSARTVLRMMTGGREEKQIYSEELLQSVIDVVKKTLDHCIVPVVEARSSSPSAALFEATSSHKKVISQLLFDASRVMALLAKLLSKVEIAETIITGIEFFALPLLFAENAHSEKESILGIQKFESLRHTAMDMIATLFSKYPGQRLFLFDEILSSLQKLPVIRQHARHFKLADGPSIQLVSALIMRLIQTSATCSTGVIKKAAKRKLPSYEVQQESETESSQEERFKAAEKIEEHADSDPSEDNEHSSQDFAMQRLGKEANSHLDNAAKSAQYVVKYLVQRAMTASKTGDQPHRQLLELFLEDFITVLGLPEWPAAELLLQILFANCRNIAENQKSLAPAKNMALEILGQMGSAISELVSNTRHAARGLEGHESQYSGYLRQMLDDYMDGSLETSEVVIWGGPYLAVADYLQNKKSDDPQVVSAQAYYLARWAKVVASGALKADSKSEELASKLRKMLLGADWPVFGDLDGLTNTQIRIAYALTVLSMDFCRQFDYILKILLDSVTSEQITVRTRSLKSVTQMLEKDPSLLDRARSVKTLITNCATDASPMVRDSALTLIGKCITLRPALEQDFLRHVLKLSDDPATGVRKRSMKLLKDIYLRNTEKSVKTIISDSMLQRVKDPDTGVSDLTRQTFEEIWFLPYDAFPDLADATVPDKLALRAQVGLMINTVQRGERVSSVLIHLLQDILSNKSKSFAANFKVCKSLVATAFEIMIDHTQEAEGLEQRYILQTLTVFAKASARLFTPDQLENLQPYITNLSGKDDLDFFRSIVIIFRCVLPVLSTIQQTLLQNIQKALLQSVSRLGKGELNEVAECLWTINRTLHNPEILIKMIAAVLTHLRRLERGAIKFADPEQRENLGRVRKYIRIAGCFGKHCDFESHEKAFQSSLDWWKGGSVAGLIVQSVNPFTSSNQPLSLRAEAFDSIGLVCQSWPYQFTQEHISNAFQVILRKGEPELQIIVLSSFRDFFARIDRQAEGKGELALAGPELPAGGKLGGSMTANDGDGASALIAQRFLKDVLNIALASQDNSALTATEVIASINRQGLVHPKESGPALVALETSINPAIANVAFHEHRLLHQQHESMFEREYMRAIQEAFRYQKDIVKDTLGYTTQPYASKLCGMFDIIKTSKGKYQKKFLSNLCSKIDFDILKTDPSNVLQFSRFLTENLAFFDYGGLDELLHTISCMERIVADTGSGVAHSISTEIFHITVESMPVATSENAPQNQGPSVGASVMVNPSRLRQLSNASVILSSLWEARSHLRRLYGLSASQQKRESKKGAAKDPSKAPSRNPGITGDKVVAAIAEKVASLDSEESMMQQCKDFVELLSVDNEMKVAAEGEEDLERPETPSGDEERDTPMSGGSRTLKRKGSVSIAGTPMKKRRGRPSLKSKKSGKSIGSDEDWD